MNNAAIFALYNCGPGNLQYTYGVLDALGYSDLATEIKAAAMDMAQHSLAKVEGDSFMDFLNAAPPSDEYFAANARLNAAFEKVDAIKEALKAE